MQKDMKEGMEVKTSKSGRRGEIEMESRDTGLGGISRLLKQKMKR